MGRSRKRSKAKPRGSHLYTIGLGSCTPGLPYEGTEESPSSPDPAPAPIPTPIPIPNYDSWGKTTRSEVPGASVRVPNEWVTSQNSMLMHQYARERELQQQNTQQQNSPNDNYASRIPIANVLESQTTLANPFAEHHKPASSWYGQTETVSTVPNTEGSAYLGLTHTVPNALNLGGDASRFGRYENAYGNIRSDSTHMNMMQSNRVQQAEHRPQKISDWAKPDRYDTRGVDSSIWQPTSEEPTNNEFMAHASPWLYSRPAQSTQTGHGPENRDLYKGWREPSTPSPRNIQRSTHADLWKYTLGHQRGRY